MRSVFHGQSAFSYSLRAEVCRKVIALCTALQSCHLLSVSTWFFRNSTELRYAYGWIALYYHSEWLHLVGWILNMWGVGIYVFMTGFATIIIVTYTTTCTHWLGVLVKGKASLEVKIGLYRQLRLLNTQFCTSSVGTIAGHLIF